MPSYLDVTLQNLVLAVIFLGFAIGGLLAVVHSMWDPDRRRERRQRFRAGLACALFGTLLCLLLSRSWINASSFQFSCEDVSQLTIDRAKPGQNDEPENPITVKDRQLIADFCADLETMTPAWPMSLGDTALEGYQITMTFSDGHPVLHYTFYKCRDHTGSTYYYLVPQTSTANNAWTHPEVGWYNCPDGFEWISTQIDDRKE